MNRFLTILLFLLVGIIVVEGIYYLKISNIPTSPKGFAGQGKYQKTNIYTNQQNNIQFSTTRYRKDGIKAKIAQIQDIGLMLFTEKGERKFYQYAGRVYISYANSTNYLKTDVLKVNQEIEIGVKKDKTGEEKINVIVIEK